MKGNTDLEDFDFEDDDEDEPEAEHRDTSKMKKTDGETYDPVTDNPFGKDDDTETGLWQRGKSRRAFFPTLRGLPLQGAVPLCGVLYQKFVFENF